MDSQSLLVLFAIFLAMFTQSFSGFGMALVAMPLLSTLLPLTVVTPLVALSGTLAKSILVVVFRDTLDVKVVWRLVLASALFVPLGAAALDVLDLRTSLAVLGIVVIAYVLLVAARVRLPAMTHPAWVYIIGAVAGLLGGAYNASGPPVVMYANSQNWEPAAFKSNLQGYAFINGLWIVLIHLGRNNYTPEVWRLFVLSIPAVVLGVWLGVKLGDVIRREDFRRVVLLVLFLLGLRLLYDALQA